MGHWIGAVACAVVAALATQCKSKNLPLASVLVGAAFVLTRIGRPASKSASKEPTEDILTSAEHIEGTPDVENEDAAALKQVHLRLNTQEVEVIEGLQVPAVDEIMQIKVDSAVHLEFWSKKHGEEPNSCTRSVLDTESHLNLSGEETEGYSQKVEVTILPSCMDMNEDGHNSTKAYCSEHASDTPQEIRNFKSTELVDESTGNEETNRFKGEGFQNDIEGLRTVQLDSWQESTILEGRNVSVVDGRKGAVNSMPRFSQLGQSDAESQSLIYDCPEGEGHVRTPSDIASSSTIESKKTTFPHEIKTSESEVIIGFKEIGNVQVKDSRKEIEVPSPVPVVDSWQESDALERRKVSGGYGREDAVESLPRLSQSGQSDAESLFLINDFSEAKSHIRSPIDKASSSTTATKDFKMTQESSSSDCEGLSDESTGSKESERFRVKDSRMDKKGSLPLQVLSSWLESNVLERGKISEGDGREDVLESVTKVSPMGRSDAESQSVINDYPEVQGHLGSPGDAASSSTGDTKGIMMHTPGRRPTSSESCSSSLSNSLSEVGLISKGRIRNVRSAESDPQTPTSCVSAVGSSDGDDFTAESSPTTSSQPGTLETRAGEIAPRSLLKSSSRAAQEERLRSYEAYLADPTLSPSIKKQVLRARKIALQRLNMGQA